jgi:hypothetical protein
MPDAMRAPLWISGLLALTASRASLAAESTAPVGGDFAAALAAAEQRFVAGDLPGALQILEPVCADADRPECAFALGAIHHGLGHCETALGHYRHYRELAPTGEHRAEVDAALQEVEAQCGTHASPLPAPTPALPPAPALAPPQTPSVPAVPPAVPAPIETGRTPAPAPDPLQRTLMVGAFALSGAATASSVVFGILAAQSADRCRHHPAYDQSYIDECEHAGPSYQGLWQGFALAAGAFAGIGATLWWFDSSSSAAVEVAGTGTPTLQYRRSF